MANFHMSELQSPTVPINVSRDDMYYLRVIQLTDDNNFSYHLPN